ncbi:hypothetical protein OG453_07670 [Streptomyces sp. NBC_01381]|uniref:DUF6875 domain-containing protein n=1 Tax=Streptomyces sp. NBC_01381 TaxID=2903845 RepID=UPI0022590D0F|nr:hypothetical protein [Streptomyces sp. NBC_01381]MCX4666548.1 hypothetical protein [Streptomyces sp. NBC_01381]
MTVASRSDAPRPSAGALRLIEPRTTTPTSVDVSGYINQVSEHCPYLPPSLSRGLTGWTVYQVATSDTEAVEAEVFHAGVQAAEWIRPLATRAHGALVCENVVILGGERLGGDHLDLLAWPHWALKNLYAPVGVMLGKFHWGEERHDRAGRSIPIPPCSFLPVRPAVRKRDPRFLRDTPELADTLAVAVDDGRDVFAELPNDWQAVKAWSSSLLVHHKPSPQPKQLAAALST